MFLFKSKDNKKIVYLLNSTIDFRGVDKVEHKIGLKIIF